MNPLDSSYQSKRKQDLCEKPHEALVSRSLRPLVSKASRVKLLFPALITESGFYRHPLKSPRRLCRHPSVHPHDVFFPYPLQRHKFQSPRGGHGWRAHSSTTQVSHAESKDWASKVRLSSSESSDMYLSIKKELELCGAGGTWCLLEYDCA